MTLTIPKGISVFEVTIVSGGNINLATIAFRPDRQGSAITEFKTALSPVTKP